MFTGRHFIGAGTLGLQVNCTGREKADACLIKDFLNILGHIARQQLRYINSLIG